MMAETVKQWVNLERDQKFVDGKEITSIERVGYVKVNCKLQKQKLKSFKINLVVKGTPADYSTREKTITPFMDRYGRSQQNKGKSQVILDEEVYLPAAGGVTYELEGKTNKK